HVGLGVIASVYLPSTSPKSRFLGEDQAVPQIMGILDKEFGRQGRLRIALNAGIRIRQTRTFTDNEMTDGPTTPTTNQSITAGRGLLPNKGANPDLRAFIGIVFEPNIGDRDGDGIKDDIDKCPDDPEDFDGFEDEDGCPDPDNDRDGIPDVDDKCPNVPEDKDGFEDEDGCPDGVNNDRDGDGITDDNDNYPDDHQDVDNHQDEDDCPDP